MLQIVIELVTLRATLTFLQALTLFFLPFIVRHLVKFFSCCLLPTKLVTDLCRLSTATLALNNRKCYVNKQHAAPREVLTIAACKQKDILIHNRAHFCSHSQRIRRDNYIHVFIVVKFSAEKTNLNHQRR